MDNWLRQQREKLMAKHRRLEHTLETMEENGLGEAFRDSMGDLSFNDNHPADLGTESFERSKDIGLRDNIRHLLDDIDDTLDLMDQGQYGICVRCGQPIPKERLEAIPSATRCEECQHKEEIYAQDSRPVEEEVLGPSFAHSFMDDNEYNGYDGEDAWQDVASYGTANSPQDEPDAINNVGDSYSNADEREGIVEDVEGIIDLTRGEEDQQALIYPDPTMKRPRRPHKTDMVFPDEGKEGMPTNRIKRNDPEEQV